MVDTNATRLNRTAVLVSPLYNRSREGHSKCLKFRYMLRGPGKKTLTIYQKVDSHRETPVWVSRKKPGAKWIYGQVPLSSISQLQVTIMLRSIIIVSVSSSFKLSGVGGQTLASCSIIRCPTPKIKHVSICPVIALGPVVQNRNLTKRRLRLIVY